MMLTPGDFVFLVLVIYAVAGITAAALYVFAKWLTK